MNPVRDLLKSGKTVVGTAGSLYEDNMAMLADSGLDFILFDSQHAPVEVKQYQRSIQAMRGKKAAPIVRVSANRADVICFALDLGARGIIVPMVNTKDEAEAMVRACLYSPLGERSNAGVRGEWGETTDCSGSLSLCVNNSRTVSPLCNASESRECWGWEAVRRLHCPCNAVVYRQ
jgi:2-keto-3-deoxy-L-rhamnonate aldolase RhmA